MASYGYLWLLIVIHGYLNTDCSIFRETDEYPAQRNPHTMDKYIHIHPLVIQHSY